MSIKQFAVWVVAIALASNARAALIASLSVEYEVIPDGRTQYDYTLTNLLESEYPLDTFVLDTGSNLEMEILAPEGWFVDYAPEEFTFELALTSDAVAALQPGESAEFTLIAAASPRTLPYFLANFNLSDQEGGYILGDILSPSQLYGTRRGDTNDDGVVDLIDLNNVRNNFGATGDPILGDTEPFSGKVDLYDLNQVRNYFGRNYNTPVPEPGALSLCAIGFFAIVLHRARLRPGQNPACGHTESIGHRNAC